MRIEFDDDLAQVPTILKMAAVWLRANGARILAGIGVSTIRVTVTFKSGREHSATIRVDGDAVR